MSFEKTPRAHAKAIRAPEGQIDESLAKAILRACYLIDAKLAKLKRNAAHCSDEDRVDTLVANFAELSTIVGADIMLPLFERHPALGRIMEPGEWLDAELAKRRFGDYET
jgi:hypothetical protein